MLATCHHASHELLQHVLRTRFIACLWSNAHNAKMIDLQPTDYGWKNADGKFIIIWFLDDQLPKTYEDVVITPDILQDSPESDVQAEDEIDDEIESDENDSNDEYED
ncbi:hypothetical protein PV328_011986 [Microctonus aethiopoides]|uniref:Uncharacterized protein n=1 Tax=Microctonus aethiopoides TaxID=144406 RepID=A0AA39KQ61_9HYME|nr:hypothetical protein PV328_011986 [Microctonus aethiopoides]